MLFTTNSPLEEQVQCKPSFWAFLEDQKAPRLTEVSEYWREKREGRIFRKRKRKKAVVQAGGGNSVKP